VERRAAAQTKRSDPWSCGGSGLELQLRACGSTYSNDHSMHKRAHNNQKYIHLLLIFVRNHDSEHPAPAVWTRAQDTSVRSARGVCTGVSASTSVSPPRAYPRPRHRAPRPVVGLGVGMACALSAAEQTLRLRGAEHATPPRVVGVHLWGPVQSDACRKSADAHTQPGIRHSGCHARTALVRAALSRVQASRPLPSSSPAKSRAAPPPQSQGQVVRLWLRQRARSRATRARERTRARKAGKPPGEDSRRAAWRRDREDERDRTAGGRRLRECGRGEAADATCGLLEHEDERKGRPGMEGRPGPEETLWLQKLLV
jgi:hypothetical protein